MKKFLSMILALALVMSLMGTAAFAADPTETVKFTVEGGQICPGNTTINVQVAIDALPANSEGFSSVNLELEYDADVLELAEDGAITTSITGAALAYSNVTNKVAMSTADNIRTEGAYMEIVFGVKEGAPAGVYTVNLKITSVRNVAGDRLETEVVAGTVTIGHVAEVIPGYGATCGAAGLTDGSKCSVCGEILTAQENIGATGEHNYATEIERVNATCTEDGYVINECTCGATETTVIPATGHSEGWAIRDGYVAPTCTEKGYYYDVTFCGNCGEEISRDYVEIPATGHGETEIRDAVAAGCGTDGYTGDTYCVDCGEKLADGTVIPATGEHNYATEIERVNATCTEEGYVINECTCGATETTVIPATGHGETEIRDAVAAGCGTDGYTGDTYCVDCGEKLADGTVIPATGEHNYATEIERVNATCTTDGYVINECTCGATETTVISATGHSEGWEIRDGYVAPTCTEKGYYYDVTFCGNCGEEISRDYVEIPATGHGETEIRDAVAAGCGTDGYTGDTYCVDCGEKLADGTVIPATGEHNYATEIERVNATCTEEGYVINECTCGATETTVIPATGHGETEIRDIVVAGCGNDGYTGNTYCVDCGEKLADGTVIPATGEHNYATEIERVDATCTEAGYVTYACICGDTVTQTLPTNGSHTYPAESVIENYVAATHENDGSYDEVFYCEACGEELERKHVTVPAGIHSWKVIVIAPTCTDWGCTLHICMDLDCHATYADAYKPALGHQYEAVVTAPTCTEGGFTTYTCVCGDTYVADYTEATGHGTYAVVFKGGPTCTEHANITVTCNGCGYVVPAEEWLTWESFVGMEALGHNYTEATCTEDGACTRCGDVKEAATGHGTYSVVYKGGPTCTEHANITVTCNGCGYVVPAEEWLTWESFVGMEALGHNYTEATCTEDGACTRCGDVKEAATGHNFGEAVVITPATCTEKGMAVATCACGETQETVIDELGHTEEIIPGKAPTCEDAGLTEGKKCATCGEILVEQEEIAAHGHNFDEDGNCTICGTPKTGDGTVMLLVLMAMMAMAGAAALVMKKKYF